MLNVTKIKPDILARILLLEDHEDIDPENIGNEWNGDVDEVAPVSAADGLSRYGVTYSQVASDESSAFPNGKIEASSTLTPGEHDAYCSGMVILFDELDEKHLVILDGSHSGGGNSDESHDGYFSGTITIVPREMAAEELERALAQNRAQELDDMAYKISGITRALDNHNRAEIEASPLWKALGGLNRAVAGS